MRSLRKPPLGGLLIVAGMGPILIGTGWAAASGRWLRDHPSAASSSVLSIAAVAVGLLVIGAYWMGGGRTGVTTTDPLTGLPMRHALWEAIDAAVDERGQTAGLLVIDLDGMGDVNDMVGFDRGDRVLTELASRLRAEAQPGDHLARLGGDQFGLLRESCADPAEMLELGRHLAAALRAPVEIDGIELRVGAVVGAAVSGEDTPDGAALRAHAEAARYQASRHGVGAVEVHRGGPDGELSPAQLTSWLAPALARDELLLHHQPIVDLHTGDVVATEALLRWAHPKLGTLSPASMLRGLEQSGHIVDVGAWVIADACRQLRSWREQAGEATQSLVFVNISLRQLLEPGFARTVDDALSRHDVSGEHLCFELGHLGELDARSSAWASLRETRTLGVRLAIDNFGYAASSFAMLHRLPIDYLKLDRHLVAARGGTAHQDAVTAAVVAMGIELGCTVVAEGLEDAESTDRARRFGCHLGQGYHLGLPVRGDELAHRLMTRRAATVG